MPSFLELGVRKDIVTRLAARDVTEPFPIQAATIEDALAGRDVCGRAPTGSGKTLAFGIPLVTAVDAKAAPRRPRGLVLVPTRELAIQVANELMSIGGPKARVATVYGGVPYGKQLQALRRGSDIVVATPGRLKDLVDRNELQLGDVSFVVLDEADRMADMGFLPEVRRILDQVRDDRQTLLFSATLDGDISTLIERYQDNPVRHEVEGADDAPENMHVFMKVRTPDRVAATAEIVKKEYSAIVFCRTKHGADRLAVQLEGLGVSATAIHGDRTQKQRERALHLFSSGKVQCLVATDVAARGIHVDNVGCVVHFDPAQDDKDYVHRSGRTGRAGTTGTVVSMLLPNQVKLGYARARRLELEVQEEMPVFDGPARVFVAPKHVEEADEAPAKPKFEGRKRKPDAKSEWTPRAKSDWKPKAKSEWKPKAAKSERKPEWKRDDQSPREFRGEQKFEKRNDWAPKPKKEWKPKAEYLAEKAAAEGRPSGAKPKKKPGTVGGVARKYDESTRRPPRGAKVGDTSRGRKKPVSAKKRAR